ERAEQRPADRVEAHIGPGWQAAREHAARRFDLRKPVWPFKDFVRREVPLMRKSVPEMGDGRPLHAKMAILDRLCGIGADEVSFGDVDATREAVATIHHEDLLVVAHVQ